MNTLAHLSNAKKIIINMTFFIAAAVFCAAISGCQDVEKVDNKVQMKIEEAPKDFVRKEAFVQQLINNDQYQPILKGRPQSCGMRSGRVYLASGKSCGLHSTNAHEEQLVFLNGSGEAWLDDGETAKPYQVGKGKIIYIPPFTSHNIKNTSDEPLIYIYCVAPISEK